MCDSLNKYHKRIFFIWANVITNSIYSRIKLQTEQNLHIITQLVKTTNYIKWKRCTRLFIIVPTKYHLNDTKKKKKKKNEREIKYYRSAICFHSEASSETKNILAYIQLCSTSHSQTISHFTAKITICSSGQNDNTRWLYQQDRNCVHSLNKEQCGK